MNPRSSQPLSFDELAHLAALLDTIGAMNIEMLDGYFTALICGPDMVLPCEYLPEVCGAESSFNTDEQVSDIRSLLMRHWNAIAAELHSTLKEQNVYLPILIERDDGVAPGNDWAHGFMRGVQMRSGSWNHLIHDENHCGSMLAIMILHYEHDPDPQMRPPPIPPEKREALLELIIAGLTHVYRYFEPYRQARARTGSSRNAVQWSANRVE
ncbi:MULTISPECIES: UPF0149 family protein [Cupriavidus]|uniref:UPF0149 family protein n=1 Tax=Cupriavidus sp. DF5525 TaxID=3160989 RepID=UPI000403B159